MLKAMLVVLMISMTIVFYRLIMGKTVWEKLLALNLFAVQTAMLIITYAVYINSPFVMDVAITYSIIGFWALILLTRFVSNGGHR